jgi:hypothetical protein
MSERLKSLWIGGTFAYLNSHGYAALHLGPLLL